MRTLYLLCFLLLAFPVCFFAQDSGQKEEVLSARKQEKEKVKNREYCAKLTFQQGISENRCFESYPTDLMTWGKGFSDGLAKITLVGKAGFINEKGQVVIKPKFKDVGRFAEGLAPFEDDNGKWGFINKDGRVAIKPSFDWALSFSEGLALVQVGDRWGYIDRTGRIEIEPRFEEASSFSEGFAVVGWYDKNFVWTTHKTTNGKWQRNFIDKSGTIKFSKSFDGISRNFNRGMALVSQNVGYNNGVLSENFFIDAKGNKLWILDSWYIAWFSDDVIVVAVDRDEYSFLDRTGKQLTEKSFDYLSGFSEGLSFARIDDKVGFIDKQGDFVIETGFKSALPFSEGLAGAEDNVGKYGFIDKSGKWVIQPKYGWVSSFQNGFALVAPNGDRETREKTGYIDRTGSYIWKPTK